MRRFATIAVIITLLLTVLPTVTLAYTDQPTVDDLAFILNGLKHAGWIDEYSVNEFDCSNMSALLDTLLKSFGFESYILCGTAYDTRNGTRIPLGGHVMLLVFCNTNGRDSAYWVETTNLQFFPATSLYNHYFVAQNVFFDANEAMRAMPKEFTMSKDQINRLVSNLKYRMYR